MKLYEIAFNEITTKSNFISLHEIQQNEMQLIQLNDAKNEVCTKQIE